MRNKFDMQLEVLNEQLVQMGGLIESAITNAVKALIEQDKTYAEAAVNFDKEADQKEKDIERLCLKLLLQQQPVARDLRLISAALKMITDMERIGDQSSDIAEIATTLSETPLNHHKEHLKAMAKATIDMVNKSIDAFVKKDINLAKEVILSDDTVDNLFVTIKDDLINLIHENPKSGEIALDMLMAAKYFERIGDHATNIAEWVIFSITGKHKA